MRMADQPQTGRCFLQSARPVCIWAVAAWPRHESRKAAGESGFSGCHGPVNDRAVTLD
jgi:hypothetical protein